MIGRMDGWMAAWVDGWMEMNTRIGVATIN